MRVAVLAGVVLLLSCSGEIPDEPNAGEPVPCQTSDECPEGYRCGADSVRVDDRQQERGEPTPLCLPVCVDTLNEGCALPACEPWTTDSKGDRFAELSRQADGGSISSYDCGEGLGVSVRWMCGYSSGIAAASDTNVDPWEWSEWRAWNRVDVDACPLFFGPDADPDPWPFTF